MPISIIQVMSSIYNAMLSPIASRIFLVIIILLLGFIIGRIVGKLLFEVLHEIELNNLLKNVLKLRIDADKLLSACVSYCIYTVTIIWVLLILSLAKVILYVVIAAVVIFIAVSLILMAKDFFPNMIAGAVIRKRKVISAGDSVEGSDFKGTVLEVKSTKVKIETKDKDVLHVPNSRILDRKVKVSRAKKSQR